MDVTCNIKIVNSYIFDESSKTECMFSLANLEEAVIAETDAPKIENLFKTLFAVRGGIFNLIRQRVQKDSDVIIAALSLIEKCISQEKQFSRYLPSAMDVCLTCAKYGCDDKVRSRGLEVLVVIVETGDSSLATKISDLIWNTLNYVDKHTGSNANQAGFELIAAIVRSYPSESKDRLPSSILRKVLRTLEQTLKGTKTAKPGVCEGCFKALDALLCNFPNECIQSVLLDFELIKHYMVKCIYDKEGIKKTAARAGLSLIERHCSLLFEKIYADYECWRNILYKWLSDKNVDNRRSAFFALDSIYTEIGQKLKSSSSLEDEKILQSILDDFKNNTEKHDIGSYEAILAVKGFGKLAEACKRHNKLQGTDLFRHIFSQVEHKLLSNEQQFVDYLGDYLVSLSEVACTLEHTLTEDELAVLEKFTVHMIEFYPKMSTNDKRKNASRSIIKVVINLSKIAEDILDTYLQKFVYMGIVKSCIHPLKSEAELLKIAQESSSEIVTYKDYVNLWKDLCDVRRINAAVLGESIYLLLVGNKLYDKFVECTLELTQVLDLSSLEQDEHSAIDSETDAREQPEKTDHLIFANLVDLFTKVIREHDESASDRYDRFIKWIPQFLTKIINFSIKYQIKSPFYKLLSVVFNAISICDYFKGREQSNSEVQQVNEFLKFSVEHIKEHSSSDLVEFFNMFIELPTVCVNSVIDYLPTVFEGICSYGMDDLKLVRSSIDALLRWKSEISQESFHSTMKSVLPNLNTFLQSKSFTGDAEIMSKYERSLLKPPKTGYRRKYSNIIPKTKDQETKLEELRKHIVKFISQLDTETCALLLESSKEEIWEFTDMLHVPISFRDMQLDIYLDALLPYVIELATGCADNKTRIAACEVLHATVIVLLGQSSSLVRTKKEDTLKLFATLMSVTFRLGSDTNTVIRQLFPPLCYGTVHYCVVAEDCDIQYVKIILDIIFDGITSENDTSLKDLCLDLLREFVDWSRRQKTTGQRNVTFVIDRICLYCTHRLSCKRIGAVLAFKCLCNILKEDSIAKEFVFELLYHFMSSLSFEDSSKYASRVLDTISNMMEQKSELFLQPCATARKPKNLEEASIKGVIDWLLPKCRSQNLVCRQQCMSIISKLAKKIPGCDPNYLTYLKAQRGPIEFVKMFEDEFPDLNASSSDVFLIRLNHWLDTLTVSLDCYTWLFRDRYISLEDLQKGESKFLDAICFFLSNVAVANFKDFMTAFNVLNGSYTFSDEERNNGKKRNIIFGIFSFIVAFSNIESFDNVDFPPALWEVVTSYLFDTSWHTEGKNQGVLKELLLTLKEKAPEAKFSRLKCNLKEVGKVRLENFVDTIPQIILHKSKVSTDHRNVLELLHVLQRTGIFELSDMHELISPEDIIKTVFASSIANNTPVPVDKTDISWIHNLLRLCFSLSPKISGIVWLVEKILDGDVIECKETKTKTSKGEHLFSLFKAPIVEMLLKNQAYFVDIVFDSRHKSALKQTINILTCCLYYAADTKRKINADTIVEKIFVQWSALQNWCEDSGLPVSFLVSLIVAVVITRRPSVGCLRNHNSLVVFSWILARLSDPKESKYLKSHILHLLPCLASDQFRQEYDINLEEALEKLKQEYLNVGITSSLKPGSGERKTYEVIFKKILYSMRVTCSPVILKFIIQLVMGDHNHICAEDLQNSFSILMNTLPAKQQHDVIRTAYQIYRDKDTSPEEFIGCVKLCLSHMIYFADGEVTEQFFNCSIDDILNDIDCLFHDKSAWKRTLSRKIGSFMLLEALFKSHPPLVNTVHVKVVTKKAREVICKTAPLDIESSNKELCRQIRCAAYNTLIAIIMKKSDPKLYILLFKEFEKGKYIWDLILNLNVVYTFPVKFDKIPVRKKHLVERRRQMRSAENIPQTLIPSQYLSSSSLAEDVIKFDMSGTHVRSSDNVIDVSKPQEDVVVIELEETLLNNHECMSNLCGFMKSTLDSNTEQKIPDWMQFILCAYTKQCRNVRLYITNLIINCEEVFRPYASYWMKHIMKFITCENNINYFVADVIIILLEWRRISIPESEEEKKLVSEVLRFLITSSDSKIVSVLHYNVRLVESFMDEYHNCISHVPYDLLLKNEPVVVTIRVSRKLFQYNILPFSELTVDEYSAKLMEITEKMVKKEYEMVKSNDVKVAFEIVGFVLKYYCNTKGQPLTRQNCELLSKLLSLLNKNKGSIPDYLDYVFNVQKHYSAILDDCLLFILSVFPRSAVGLKMKLLPILENTTLTVETFMNLMNSNFLYCLKENYHEVQLIALKIVKNVIDKLQVDIVEKIFPVLKELLDHVDPDCRKTVYEIMELIWKKLGGRSDDPSWSRILQECKRGMLKGIFDKDAELQDLVIRKFWLDGMKHLDKISERSLKIFEDMYMPDIENMFLNYSVNFLLEAASLMPSFECKIFGHPLLPCTFEDQQVITSWRLQNTPSIALRKGTITQKLMSLSQSNSSFPHFKGTQFGFLIQPTLKTADTKKLSLTLPEQTFLSPTLRSGFFTVMTATSGPQRYKNGNPPTDRVVSDESFDLDFSTDFYKNIKILKSRITEDHWSSKMKYSKMHIERNKRRKQFLEERQKRKEMQVNICGSYRIGEFPDIEIKYSSIIRPLQALAKRDSTIAKQILLCIFENIGEKLRGVEKQAYMNNMGLMLNNILCNSTNTCDDALRRIVLTVGYKYFDFIKLDYDAVVSVSKSKEQLPLGCLYIEKVITKGVLDDGAPPKPKKKKLSTQAESDAKDYTHWIQLAELYDSLGELDMVTGIFCDKVGSDIGDTIRQALELEKLGRWDEARKLYSSLLGASIDYNEPAKGFAFKSCAECAAHLSKWDDFYFMDVKPKIINLDQIFETSWYRDNILPSVFESQVHIMLKESDLLDILPLLERWIWDSSKESILIDKAAENLCLLMVPLKNIEKAKLIGQKYLKQMLDDWSYVSSASDKIRYEKILSLQTISEINQALDVVSCVAKTSTNVESLLNTWTNNMPAEKSPVVHWVKRILYRNYFYELIKEHVSEFEDAQLDDFWTNSTFSLINCAIEQQHCEIANSFISVCFDRDLQNSLKWSDTFNVYWSKALLLKARKANTNEKQLVGLLESWNTLDDITDTRKNSYEVNMHLCDVNREIFQLLDRDESLVRHSNVTLLAEKCTRYYKKLKKIENGDIIEKFKDFGLQSLIRATEEEQKFSQHRAEPYLSIARYCDQYYKSEDGQIGIVYQEYIIKGILQGMKYGSVEAYQLFSTILQLPNLQDLCHVFQEESSKVEEWKFLSWINQLIANIDTALVSVIEPILIRLAKSYPKALQFPFLLSYEKFSYKCKGTKSLVNRMKSMLNNSSLRDFIKALSYVCKPDMKLNASLQEAAGYFRDGNQQEVISVVSKLYEDLFEDGSAMKGEFYEVLKPCRKGIESLLEILRSGKSTQDVTSKLRNIYEMVDRECRQHSKKYRSDELRSYSPWLSDFSCHGIPDIEIPGQYTGLSKPLLEYHTMIFGFKDTVRIMESIKNPIKITILGNDAKEYNYLVKCDEDLRQDNRIQQLLNLMNRSLASNQIRKLSVVTYAVIPLRRDLGLIQWVEDTIPFDAFMNYKMSQNDAQKLKMSLVETRNAHTNWICKAAPGSGSMLEIFGSALTKYSRDEIIGKFRLFCSSIQNDVLREALMRLCNDIQMFVSLRSSFITSYAAMSICHWILGIGDRHLENTLICLKTGRCIGIDFGRAFGMATQGLQVPELIPFRMTPHIEAIMDPFGRSGLVRETMVRCLQTLCRDSHVLMSAMLVFVQEPSVDWNKNSKLQQPVSEDDSDITYYESERSIWKHDAKLHLVRQKFEGENPKNVFLQELDNNAYISGEQYHEAYRTVIQGNDFFNLRARLPSSNLTPSQQVDCLLDLATDEYVLGIAFFGLQTWI